MTSLPKEDGIVQVKQKVTHDLYYPKFHVAAPSGWINDPNGLIYMNGYYHFFFQYHPDGPIWGPMHWGHVISKDLIHWKHLPIALSPDQEYDNGGCFSGSAVNNNGILTLFYTGNTTIKVEENYTKTRQVQCMATSKDGIHFVKHGPVLSPPKGIAHFRDPKVWCAREYWWMVVGTNENGLGEVLLYQSTNLTDWKFVRILHQASTIQEGFMWECPDFFNVDNKDVLVTSPQGIPEQEYSYRNLYQSGYHYGIWEKDTSFTVQKDFTEIDHGHDFYAPQTFEAADGRRIMIGWMNMWQSPIPKEQQWAGAFTLPRVINYDKQRGLLCTPIKELEKLRTNHKDLKSFTVTNNPVILTERYQEYKISFDTANSTAKNYGFAIGDALKLDIDPQAKRIFLTRQSTMLSLNTERSIPLPARSKINLHLFVDASSIEIFINDGEYSMSSIYYPDEKNNKLSFYAKNGNAVIPTAEAWNLSEIFVAFENE